MELLTRAITADRLVELIVLLMLLEAALLLLWRRRTGGGVPAVGSIAMIAAGVGLMLALRAALIDADPRSIAGWLSLALVAHVVDVVTRWQRPSRGRSRSREPAGGHAPQ